VLVPPTEYDPTTSEPTGAPVEVGPGGVVTTWTWISTPRPKHPLTQPFAWALIRLDGADTAMLHAVDAGSESSMAAGMRVTPRWSTKRVGHIKDIECFVPEGAQ
ncbi:MAG TPA: OB-fold domain-containing protein, partial [Acidimicrobiia bacterium]|nr:OB-fold domain-containing protein [Acidimicrobiia bacterium]